MFQKKKRGGVLYAKYANVGDVVHGRATEITSHQQCRRWFGDAWKDKWLSGKISRVEHMDGKRYFIIQFERPDGHLEDTLLRDLKCRPGQWEDPRPPPAIQIHGDGPIVLPTTTDDSPPSPNLLMDSQPPETNEDDDGVSALGESPNESIRFGLFPTEAGMDDEDDDDDETQPPTPTRTVAVVEPVVQTDSFSWYTDNLVTEEVNGPVREIEWAFRDQSGTWMKEEDDLGCKRPLLDYFMATFPPAALKRILKLTNEKLEEAECSEMDVGDLLKFFGVLLLITRFEFGDRASLWSTTTHSPYIPAVCMGETTGMPRKRFDAIWRFLTFSECPEERPDGVSSAAHRWMHVDDFIADFNHHRRNNFRPTEIICVDESMSRWYGIGGDWINEGLPQYIAMDRKVSWVDCCIPDLTLFLSFFSSFTSPKTAARYRTRLVVNPAS